MLKKHKVLFIILGIGAIYLIYLLYKNYQAGATAAAGQAAALDTSNIPTIISTGDGGGSSWEGHGGAVGAVQGKSFEEV